MVVNGVRLHLSHSFAFSFLCAAIDLTKEDDNATVVAAPPPTSEVVTKTAVVEALGKVYESKPLADRVFLPLITTDVVELGEWQHTGFVCSQEQDCPNYIFDIHSTNMVSISH